MRFFSTVLLLITVVLVICVPYFVGHGLAVHQSRWVLSGIICGVLAALLIFVGIRIRPRPRPDATRQPHA